MLFGAADAPDIISVSDICPVCKGPLDVDGAERARALESCGHNECHLACAQAVFDTIFEEKQYKILRCPRQDCLKILTPGDLRAQGRTQADIVAYEEYLKAPASDSIPAVIIAPADSCDICLESLDKKDAMALSRCNHATSHVACMSLAIDDAFASNDMLKIRCSKPGCVKCLIPQDLSNFKRPQAQVDAYKVQVKVCPKAGCSWTFQADPQDKCSMVCELCSASYCTACLKDHLESDACVLTEEEKLALFSQECLTKKLCPDCGILCEVDENCKFVQCCSWQTKRLELCIVCGRLVTVHAIHPCRLFDDNEIYICQEERALDAEFQREWDAGIWNKPEFDLRREALKAELRERKLNRVQQPGVSQQPTALEPAVLVAQEQSGPPAV